jgi:hypothetical protein
MDFYAAQSPKVQEKIEYVFQLIRTVDQVPKKFLDHLSGSDGLFEIRIESGNNIFSHFLLLRQRESSCVIQWILEEDTKNSKARNGTCGET